MGKKIVRITESELIKIIKNIISEETKIVTDHDKSFDYKKDGNKYYFKGKGKFKTKYPDWTLADDEDSIDSIKTKVFKDFKEDDDITPEEVAKNTKKIEKSIEKQDKEEKTKSPEKQSIKGTSQEVIKFLVGKGLTETQAAGIAGNLQHESGINPTVKPGDRGNSFGIAQWHKERGENMKKWTKQNGYDSSSLKGQLEYLWWELNNTEKKALSKLKETDNPKDAAFMFAKYFERCSACQDRNRIKSRLATAQKFYDSY